jgi:hypothetical protein
MPALITDRCSAASYHKPSKFKLIVKDYFDKSTLHTLDMFQPLDYNEGLNLQTVQCNPGFDTAGTFSFSFEDNEHIIDTKKVGKGNIVILQHAKDSAADYENIFYGYCRNLNLVRTATSLQHWEMTGFGSQVIFNEIMCTFIKSAKKTSISDPRPVISDVDMQLAILYTKFVTDPDVPIYGDRSLVDIGGFTYAGIDPQCKEVVTSINATNQYAGTIHKSMLDSVGAIGGVDANNDIFVHYPTKKHLDVTVKAPTSINDKFVDYGAYTSYVIGPYNAPQSLQLPEYANIITGRATINRTFLNGESGSDGVKTLNGQAIAQRFLPTSLGFKDIAFYLRKIGNPTSQKSRVHGSVILDNDNSPEGGKKIAKFYLSLDSIKETATVVTPSVFKILTKTIEASTPHWLVLYERAGNNSGDFDPDNTIQWLHNNDFTTQGQFSAIALSGKHEAEDLSWQIFPNGPTFSYSLFQISRRQSFAVDPLAVDRFGPIMLSIDSSFIDDSFTLNKYLHVELQGRSRPHIGFSEMTVTIPNNKVFKPGYMVTFLDENSTMFTIENYVQPLISQVLWNWDAKTEPLGPRTCKLLLSARYDWVSEFFTQ